MNTSSPAIIRRPDMGLAIAGTRITLYTIIEYLREGSSHEEIGGWLNLTADQMRAALEYIEAHRDEVEAEYDEVIRDAGERQRYWEARLQERLDHQQRAAPSPEKAALYAKLAEQRAQTIRELLGDDASALSEAGHS